MRRKESLSVDRPSKTASEPQRDYQWYRQLIARWFIGTTFLAGLGMSLVGLLTGGSYWPFALSGTIISLAAYFIYTRKQSELILYLLLLAYMFLVMHRSAAIKSAMNAMLLVIILPVAAILTNPRYTTVLFILDLAFVVVTASTGVLSWTQAKDPETGLYYANTVTVLLPLLVISYAVSLVISRVLINTINRQVDQYRLLQKTWDRLLVQEKLSSLRLLAGGIAHDFNNILTAIIGNINLLQHGPGDAAENRVYLSEAAKAATNARKLTSQLLMLSRDMAPVKEAALIGELITETARFTLRGSKCKPEFRLVPDLWPIEADVVQISQVVQNLILNASQAMPGGGTITLEARNQLIRKEDHLPLPGGDYILIEVSDQGTGIDPENLSKIFDPFFTTKSEGTGLGLSVCYSIVHNHGGHISVYSEAGRGSKFSVYLPAAPGAAIATTQPEVQLESRSGRVLVMDDDQGVQNILTQMLTMLGFDADVAANGDKAVLKYREAAGAGRPYRFVILDLTIAGGKGGIEALQEIRAINQGAKAIVSSGYSSALLNGDLKDHGFDAVLAKPYTLEELSRVVSMVLEV